MEMKLGMDVNGNKVLRIKNGAKRTSIQTNGNLPITHSNNKVNLSELKHYVSVYGSQHQKSMLDFLKNL